MTGGSPRLSESRITSLRATAIAATPVRETSTRPSGRIKSTKASIFDGAPVISNTKLRMGRIDRAGAENIGHAQSFDALLAGAHHLDQRQFAFNARAVRRPGRRPVHGHQAAQAAP